MRRFSFFLLIISSLFLITPSGAIAATSKVASHQASYQSKQGKTSHIRRLGKRQKYRRHQSNIKRVVGGSHNVAKLHSHIRRIVPKRYLNAPMSSRSEQDLLAQFIRQKFNHTGIDPNKTVRRHFEAGELRGLSAKVAYAVDLKTNRVLLDKNGDAVQPIASITKLMTALVLVNSGVNLNQKITISRADIPRIKHSRSRLPVGTTLTRSELLLLALMSSENRASHALARTTFPGGTAEFVKRMNQMATRLGMDKTHFYEPTGLSPKNVSTPKDLVRLIEAADKEPLIKKFSTTDHQEIYVKHGRRLMFVNSNRLIHRSDWDIEVSKTGFINEAGDCLVMKTHIKGHPVALVVLNSRSNAMRFADAARMRGIIRSQHLLY